MLGLTLIRLVPPGTFAHKSTMGKAIKSSKPDTNTSKTRSAAKEEQPIAQRRATRSTAGKPSPAAVTFNPQISTTKKASTSDAKKRKLTSIVKEKTKNTAKRQKVVVEDVHSDSDDSENSKKAIAKKAPAKKADTPNTLAKKRIDPSNEKAWTDMYVTAHAEIYVVNHRKKTSFPEHPSFSMSLDCDYALNHFHNLEKDINTELEQHYLRIKHNSLALWLFKRKIPELATTKPLNQCVPIRSIEEYRACLNDGYSSQLDPNMNQYKIDLLVTTEDLRKNASSSSVTLKKGGRPRLEFRDHELVANVRLYSPVDVEIDAKTKEECYTIKERGVLQDTFKVALRQDDWYSWYHDDGSSLSPTEYLNTKPKRIQFDDFYNRIYHAAFSNSAYRQSDGTSLLAGLPRLFMYKNKRYDCIEEFPTTPFTMWELFRRLASKSAGKKSPEIHVAFERCPGVVDVKDLPNWPRDTATDVFKASQDVPLLDATRQFVRRMLLDPSSPIYHALSGASEKNLVDHMRDHPDEGRTGEGDNDYIWDIPDFDPAKFKDSSFLRDCNLLKYNGGRPVEKQCWERDVGGVLCGNDRGVLSVPTPKTFPKSTPGSTPLVAAPASTQTCLPSVIRLDIRQLYRMDDKHVEDEDPYLAAFDYAQVIVRTEDYARPVLTVLREGCIGSRIFFLDRNVEAGHLEPHIIFGDMDGINFKQSAKQLKHLTLHQAIATVLPQGKCSVDVHVVYEPPPPDFSDCRNVLEYI